MTESKMSPLRRVKLTELNAHLVCVLCSGYFVDATTIIECLHTFCKTCIVRYLQTSSFCPICDVQVHKTKPLLSLREDRTLQDVVFKLVPGLFHSEMNRRQKFYREHPEAGGDKTEQSLRERRHFFHVDDQISLSLEYLPSTPTSIYSHFHGLKPLKMNNGQPGKGKKSTEDDKDGIKTEEGKKEEIKEEREKIPGKVVHKRYLRCPAAVQVSHLEKFIRLKYSLAAQTHKVDIMHGGDCLVGELTLLDVVYMYKWTEDAPLRLMYSVSAIPYTRKRTRPNSLRTSASNDSDAPNAKIPKTQTSVVLQQSAHIHSLSQVHPVPGRDQDGIEKSIVLENCSKTTDKVNMDIEKPVTEASSSANNISSTSHAIGIVSSPMSVNIPSIPNTILNNGIGQMPPTLPGGRRPAFTKTTAATATPRMAVPNKAFAAPDNIVAPVPATEGLSPQVVTVSAVVTSAASVCSTSPSNTANPNALTTISVSRLPINGLVEPCLKNISSTANQTEPIMQPIIPTKPRLGRPPNASRLAAANMKPGVRMGDIRAPRPVASGKIVNKAHGPINRINPVVSASLNVQSRISGINSPKPGTAKVMIKRANDISNGSDGMGVKPPSTIVNNVPSGFTSTSALALSKQLPQSTTITPHPVTSTSTLYSATTSSDTTQYSITSAFTKENQKTSQVSSEVQDSTPLPPLPCTTINLSDLNTLQLSPTQIPQKSSNIDGTNTQSIGTPVRPVFASPTGVAPQRAQSIKNQSTPNIGSSVLRTETGTRLQQNASTPQTTATLATLPGNITQSNTKTNVHNKLQTSPNSTHQRSASSSLPCKAPNTATTQGTFTNPVSNASAPGQTQNRAVPNTTTHRVPATPAPHRAPPSPAPHRAPPSPAPHRAPSSPAPHRAPPSPAPHRAPPSPAPHRAPPSPAPHRAPPSPAPHRAPPSPAPHRTPPSPAPHRAPPSPAPHRTPVTTTAQKAPPPAAHRGPSSQAPHKASPSQAPHRANQSPAPHRAPPSPAPHRAPPSPAPHRAPPSPAPHRAPPSPAPHRAPPSPAPHRAPPSPAPHRAPPSPAPHRAPPSPAPHRAPPSPAPHRAPSNPAPLRAPASQAPHRASPNSTSRKASPNSPASPPVQTSSSAAQTAGNPALQASASPASQTPAGLLVNQTPNTPVSQAGQVPPCSTSQSSQPIIPSSKQAQAATGPIETVVFASARTSAAATTSTSTVTSRSTEFSISSEDSITTISTNNFANKQGYNTKTPSNLAQETSKVPNNTNGNNSVASKVSPNQKAPKSPGRKKNSGGTSSTILSIAQNLANRQMQRTNSTQQTNPVTTNTISTTQVGNSQPYSTSPSSVVYPNPVCSALVNPALAAAYMATAYGGDTSALTDVTAIRNLLTLSQTAAMVQAAMVQAAETISRPSEPAPIDLSPTSKAAPQSPLTNGRSNSITTSPGVTSTKTSQAKTGLSKASASTASSAPTISPPTPEVTITKLPSTPSTSGATNPSPSSGKNVPALVKLTSSSTNTVSITKRPVSSNRISVTKSPANASVRQIPNPSFLRHQSEVRNNNNVTKQSHVSTTSAGLSTTSATTKAQTSTKVANNRTTGNSPLKDTGPLPETSSILKIEHLTRSLAAPAAATATTGNSSATFRFFDKR
ncbi:hypothetical protein SK128_018276 [Halocaridina rubra]|uniref:RING-type domain-containing protein n=1 Tax=Halocaridina rubra TaxID=373956 RepID=A0AAN8XHF6_HALRR